MRPPAYDPTWSDEVKALYHHDMQEIWDRTISPNIWNQYHNQLDNYFSIVAKFSQGAQTKILDVGCAQGTLALMLAEQGHHVCAVDLRSGFLEYAKSRHTHGDIRFVQGNIFNTVFDETFDVIFANQIIEHTVHPERLVRHLRGFLADRGCLVVTTPNWQYLVNRLPSFEQLGDPADYEHRQFTADADGHFFAYRAIELVEFFKAAGFSDIRTRFFETPFVSGHLKMRYVHRFVPAKLLRLFDRMTLCAPVVGKRLAHQLTIIGTAV